jgi:hypothetical protein
MHICLEWFDYDGRRDNFQLFLEPKSIVYQCVNVMILFDIYWSSMSMHIESGTNGFWSVYWIAWMWQYWWSSLLLHTRCTALCDIDCQRVSESMIEWFIWIVDRWTGAGQMCCYDYDGWLMFSDDYEYNNQYLRFYSAGVPYRYLSIFLN